MKKVFWFERVTHKLNCKEVADDYALQPGELLAQADIVHNPSPTEQLLMQQSQQITVLQTMVMQQDQDNVKLQKANAEQASQIKQLQQIFMKADQQQAIDKSKEATAQ